MWNINKWKQANREKKNKEKKNELNVECDSATKAQNHILIVTIV